MNKISYSIVTELPGSRASKEQVQRLVNRYHFAAGFCQDKDVLEVACGPGIGLGILKERARSLVAGDIDEGLLEIARRAYPNGIDLRRIDAQELPFEDNSLDVIILFEAIYYLQDPGKLVREAKRVLRPGGMVLVCNPNKDLPDFHPSAFSHYYFNPMESRNLFEPLGFQVSCYGDNPIINSFSSWFLSIIKRWAVRLNLIPDTMDHKAWLKRLIYGELVHLPVNLADEPLPPQPLIPLSTDIPDFSHRVIFCVATASDIPSIAR
jgi:SAM-dependent methyltransferase